MHVKYQAGCKVKLLLVQRLHNLTNEQSEDLKVCVTAHDGSETDGYDVILSVFVPEF